MQRMGIYIHIPFCVRKCRYCDFLSFPAAEREKDRYVQALLEEIRREAERYQDAVVDSVFIGGGTPTVLAEGALEGILACLRASFHFADEAGAANLRIAENDGDEPGTGQGKPFGMGTEARQVEITVEINPATAGRERLERLRLAGVNRLSIGTQSVHNRELAYLGRVHSAQDFFRIYRDAVEAGFANINVDLMSALPGQSAEDYMDSLRQVTALGPAHISAYSLILEEGTPFYEIYGGGDRERETQGRESKGAGLKRDMPTEAPLQEGAGCMSGKTSLQEAETLGNASLQEMEESAFGKVLPLPTEEEEREMYEQTEVFLREKGYNRYEISNYARPGMECRHNIGYWERKDYIGFGLGAASMAGNVRWKNCSDLQEYMENILIKGKTVKEDVQRLSLEEQMEEFMFLGLRLSKGVGLAKFADAFGREMKEVYGPVIEKLERQGLLEVTQEEIRLTAYGRDVSNYVMAKFLF